MIYLDHAATTYIRPDVLKEMLPWYGVDKVGNPGSIHTQGVYAFQAIETARERVAKMINADPSEIYFTSSGTESNNTILQCLKRHIVITTKLEHHSILEPLNTGSVASVYFNPIYVKVDKTGSVDIKDLESLLKQHGNAIGAVSVMWVNNELGTINPIEKIGMLCKKYDVLFHTDAVQAVGHIPIDVQCCNVDALSMSAHKFGGPLGVGVLYIRNKVRKRALIIGGGQERGLRGGTENVPGIVGAGMAAEIVSSNVLEWKSRWFNLRRTFIRELDGILLGEFFVNGDEENGSPSIISLTIPGVESESLLLLLDKDDIYISAGSACSAADHTPSHVLLGIGLSPELAASTVRISMGVDTTADELLTTANAISAAVHKIKSMYPSTKE